MQTNISFAGLDSFTGIDANIHAVIRFTITTGRRRIIYP